MHIGQNCLCISLGGRSGPIPLPSDLQRGPAPEPLPEQPPGHVNQSEVNELSSQLAVPVIVQTLPETAPILYPTF